MWCRDVAQSQIKIETMLWRESWYLQRWTNVAQFNVDLNNVETALSFSMKTSTMLCNVETLWIWSFVENKN